MQKPDGAFSLFPPTSSSAFLADNGSLVGPLAIRRIPRTPGNNCHRTHFYVLTSTTSGRCLSKVPIMSESSCGRVWSKPGARAADSFPVSSLAAVLPML